MEGQAIAPIFCSIRASWHKTLHHAGAPTADGSSRRSAKRPKTLSRSRATVSTALRAGTALNMFGVSGSPVHPWAQDGTHFFPVGTVASDPVRSLNRVHILRGRKASLFPRRRRQTQRIVVGRAAWLPSHVCRAKGSLVSLKPHRNATSRP